jgi:hypothetical protein
MPVRLTMATLITAVRDVINDPTGASQRFTDQQIQDQLDLGRTDVNYEELVPVDSITATGSVEYRQYASRFDRWEEDATLQGPSWESLTASSVDYLLGRWNFSAHQPAPVFAVGKVYDIYHAAANLLEAWAAKEKLSFDVETNEQQFLRSQKIKMILEMAATYRRKQRATSVPLVRGDIHG